MCFVFAWFLNVMMGGVGEFELFPNGELMIPDRLQYFLEHFRNDQKYDKIWTLGPRIYHQNLSTNPRKIWEHA